MRKETNMKKLVSLLLALSMLLSMALLASCDNKNKPDAETGETESDTSAPELTTADRLGFDKQNYNKEFTILVNNAYAVNERDFKIDDPGADRLSQVIHERNLACEEYLGIEITISPVAGANGSTVTKDLYTQVANGSCPYDMGAIGMGMLIQGGYINIYQNIMQMKYVDLTHNWWVEGMIDQLSMNNQLYLLAGDACQSTYTYIGCIYANLAVAENFNMDVDLYDIVKKGDWTLAKFFELYKQVGKDDNNDGNFDETETYGWCNHGIGVRLMWTAAGIEMIQRQSNGTFALRSALDTRITDLTTLFLTAFEDPHSNYVGDENDMAKAFAEDRVFLVSSWLAQAENFRKNDMESPFAILPMPKYDDTQKDYIASNSGTYNALFFPVNVSSPELCAQVAEFMGWYGKTYVVPEYYDVALKYRQNDVEANIEMLDLLREKLIVTPNESYGSITAEGVDQIMYFTQLTYYTTGKKGDGSKAFYANPASVWEKKSPAIREAINSYVFQYYQ